jgi:hypothetical protein
LDSLCPTRCGRINQKTVMNQRISECHEFGREESKVQSQRSKVKGPKSKVQVPMRHPGANEPKV